VGIRTTDPAGRSISDSRVWVVVRRDGRRVFTKRVQTGPAGRVSFRFPARRGGCFTTTVTRVASAGFTWDGRVPPNRFCRSRPRR
jgi:hypothetical protein